MRPSSTAPAAAAGTIETTAKVAAAAHLAEPDVSNGSSSSVILNPHLHDHTAVCAGHEHEATRYQGQGISEELVADSSQSCGYCFATPAASVSASRSSSETGATARAGLTGSGLLQSQMMLTAVAAAGISESMYSCCNKADSVGPPVLAGLACDLLERQHIHDVCRYTYTMYVGIHTRCM